MAFAHPGPGLLQKSPETPPSETCPSRLVAQGKLNAWRAPRMALPIFCAAFWDPAPRSPAPPGISPRLPAWSRRGTEREGIEGKTEIEPGRAQMREPVAPKHKIFQKS
ncbi:uncharacterized protein LOC144580189 isoform X2 [Callithrix jacchus]